MNRLWPNGVASQRNKAFCDDVARQIGRKPDFFLLRIGSLTGVKQGFGSLHLLIAIDGLLPSGQRRKRLVRIAIVALGEGAGVDEDVTGGGWAAAHGLLFPVKKRRS